MSIHTHLTSDPYLYVPRWYSLGLNQDVSIGGIQHSFTNELLGHRDRLVHGHTEVRKVIQEPNEKESRMLKESKQREPEPSSHRQVLHSLLKRSQAYCRLWWQWHKKSRYGRWKKRKKKTIKQKRKMTKVNERVTGPTWWGGAGQEGSSHQEETVKALGPEEPGLVDAWKPGVAGWLWH